MGGPNVPGTYQLADNIITGHRLLAESTQPLTQQEIVLVELGEESKRQLIAFHDSLICSDIPVPYSEYVPPQLCVPPKPMPMSQRYSDITDHDADLLHLTVCLQRHRCKVGLCQKMVNKELKCRWKYPKSQSDTTTISVVREKTINGKPGSYRIEINGTRMNDMRIVNHNRDQLRHWRANCDFSILHDLTKVLQYVTKYATKAETKSSVFDAAFASVFNEGSIEGIDTKQGLRKVMNKVLAERDVTIHEAIHQLLGKI